MKRKKIKEASTPKARAKTKAKTKAQAPSRLFVISKLNIRIWLRLMGIFIALDLALVLALAAGMIVYGEQRAAQVEAVVSTDAISAPGVIAGLDALGVSVATGSRQPRGIPLPSVFDSRAAPATAGALRGAAVADKADLSWLEWLETMEYRLEFAEPTGYRSIIVSLAPVIRMVRIPAAVLIVMQLLYAVNSISSGAAMIRTTLRPIVELVEKAQRLADRRGPYSPAEMEALAGKLEGITAARLDTRIEIENAEDDLRGVAEAINGMLSRIHESYRAQARFVSDASHELRTPIAAIQGYANLMDRWGKNDPDALQESIDAIKDEAASMKELIEKLLFLARGDSHTIPLQEEIFDAGELASVVLRETQMIGNSHEFLADVQPVMVYADQGLIKQALRILVDNAVKYTPVGGQIKLSVHEHQQQAWLTVQDEGVGIAPEAVSRIFDRFYRADESRARATGGSGLGLAIAKWIVERHGGTIQVVSREDLGTRLSIGLPLAPEPAANTAEPLGSDLQIKSTNAV